MSPTLDSSLRLTDPWLQDEVALAQRHLVTRQLADEKACQPFQAFLRAIEFMLAQDERLKERGGNFLEVGCGVGHYGILLHRHFPQLQYHGSDFSAAMIRHSLLPYLLVEQLPFEGSKFFLTDVLLMSQVLEMRDDPEADLRFALERMRPKSYVILHRVRITQKEPSQIIFEETYCGYPARNYIWNQIQLHELLWEYGDLLLTDYWETSLTAILKKK